MVNMAYTNSAKISFTKKIIHNFQTIFQVHVANLRLTDVLNGGILQPPWEMCAMHARAPPCRELLSSNSGDFPTWQRSFTPPFTFLKQKSTYNEWLSGSPEPRAARRVITWARGNCRGYLVRSGGAVGSDLGPRAANSPLMQWWQTIVTAIIRLWVPHRRKTCWSLLIRANSMCNNAQSSSALTQAPLN